MWWLTCSLAVRCAAYFAAVATTLQALIWSAVAASSAFPGLFHPQDLLARNARGEEVR
jgi:predicted acylesterase/phospholipase RssA